MSRAPSVIADNIIEDMRKQNLDCATLPWPKFYLICQRDRIKDSFLKNLKRELKKKSFLLVDGNAVISISKDFNFAELKKS